MAFMGNTPPNTPPNTLERIDVVAPKWSTFYAINFDNSSDDINMEPMTRNSTLELVSLHIPLFDNFDATLSTSSFVYDIGAGDVIVTIPSGFYTTGLDLVTALNLYSPLTWAFSALTKRITVSYTGAFSIDDCRLMNAVLGFAGGAVDGTALTYTAPRIMNLFPFSHYVVFCDKVSQNSYFASNRQAALTIPIDTLDFISGRTITFDTTSQYYESLGTFSGNLFPLRIQIAVKFTDNGVVFIPVKENQVFSITLKTTQN